MPNEKIVPFRIDKHKWAIIQHIARHLTVYKKGKIQQCTGSDVIRELLDEWLAEKSVEWYPKILEDYKKHNVHDSVRTMLEEEIKLYEQAKEPEGT